MKLSDVAARYNIDKYAFERFLRIKNYPTVHENFMSLVIDDIADTDSMVSDFKQYTKKQALYKALSDSYHMDRSLFDKLIAERLSIDPSYFDIVSFTTPDELELVYNDLTTFHESNSQKVATLLQQKADADAAKQAAMAQMLISSGFTFEGYRIVKYSGYISGDDAIQVSRGTAGFFSSATNVGASLMDALKKMRRQALKELKEAAYDLGCNAVIGVDFDYITLEPETANSSGGTTYLPYVFGITANGNAVIIEKIED